jgi:hypothetical protein
LRCCQQQNATLQAQSMSTLASKVLMEFRTFRSEITTQRQQPTDLL